MAPNGAGYLKHARRRSRRTRIGQCNDRHTCSACRAFPPHCVHTSATECRFGARLGNGRRWRLSKNVQRTRFPAVWPAPASTDFLLQPVVRMVLAAAGRYPSPRRPRSGSRKPRGRAGHAPGVLRAKTGPSTARAGSGAPSRTGRPPPVLRRRLRNRSATTQQPQLARSVVSRAPMRSRRNSDRRNASDLTSAGHNATLTIVTMHINTRRACVAVTYPN